MSSGLIMDINFLFFNLAISFLVLNFLPIGTKGSGSIQLAILIPNIFMSNALNIAIINIDDNIVKSKITTN